MKKYALILISIMLLPAFIISSKAQKKTMAWTTKSEKALKEAQAGVEHMLNIEFAQAYEDFKEALNADPNFTIPLVFMANLTNGETKKMYVAKALKSAADKTEGEKLFASTIAEGSKRESNHATFDKLYKMFPDGSMLGAYYIFTIDNREEAFNAALEYEKKFPDKAWVHNTLAYYYMQDKKDMGKAKECFEKYIKMYPNGCNPYDSMGEYYFNNGDMENSEKYYSMALEKYPFNISSIEKLREIKEKKSKKE